MHPPRSRNAHSSGIVVHPVTSMSVPAIKRQTTNTNPVNDLTCFILAAKVAIYTDMLASPRLPNALIFNATVARLVSYHIFYSACLLTLNH